MPVIVVDTSVALPAMLSSGGLARRLWVLLAYGALTYRAEHLRAEHDELVTLAQQEGGEVVGIGVLEAMVHDAERRRAAAAELLPADAPDDLVAVGFAALFDEYERKLRQAARRFRVELTDDNVAALRRQFEAICVAGPAPFTLEEVPALTRDRNDDPIVYGGLLADADFVISDDRDIVPDRSEHAYEHDVHHTRAVTLHRFLTDHMRPHPFEWDAIDVAVLAVALRATDDNG